MVGANKVPVSHSPTIQPLHAGGSDPGWVMILLTVTVVVAAIAGIVVAVMHGHDDIAIAVGIVGAAFLTRAAC
jgi:hypothetical protein